MGARNSQFATRYSALALGLIMLTGLALRLFTIGERGLWGDEAWRVYAARLPSIGDVIHVAWAQPPSAPLWWVGLHLWIVLFGHGDVVVRLFSVPASLGALPAIYWLGNLAVGRTVGLVAAGLLAISPMAVEVGQEATMYAWAMLLATLTVASALAWLKTGRGAARYVALAALLLYTHYMGALLIGEALVAALAWLRRPSLWGERPMVGARSWLAAHGVILLLWLPWLAAMSLRLVERWGELSRLQNRAGLPDLFNSAMNLSVSASAVATWPQSRLTLSVLVGGGLVAIALIRPGSGYQAPAAVSRRNLGFLSALVLAFIGITIGASAITGAWLVQPRFLTLVLPLTLCVVAGAASFPTAMRMRAKDDLPAGRRVGAIALRFVPVVSGLLLGAWLVAQVGGLRAFYIAPVHGRDGLREIGALLTREVQPADIVVSNHALLPWFVAQYYGGVVRALPADQDVRQGYRLWPPPDQLRLAGPQWDVLAALVASANPRRIWLLYLPAMDPDGSLLARMRQNYSELEASSYPLADLYLFSVK